MKVGEVGCEDREKLSTARKLVRNICCKLDLETSPEERIQNIIRCLA